MNLVKIVQLQTHQFRLMPMALTIQNTVFKFCQYQLRAILPNLMLAKAIHFNHIVATNTFNSFRKILC